MFTIYASNYAPINPLVPPCDINLIPIGYVGENLARCLVFDLSECVEQFGDGGFVISFLRHGDELPYLVTNTDRLEDNAIWNITDTDTAVDGYGLVQLQYIVDDVVCKSALYRTVTFESNGITGDVPDPYEDLLAQIAAYASTAQSSAAAATAAAETATTAVEEGVKTERSQRIAADEDLQTQITSLMGAVGTPLTTSVASQMTDISKIYVYTGNETGYTYGNWYYYNGAEWVSGGVYQASAVETDPTLSVEGMAADAAACGDLKRQIYSAFVEESASGNIASFTDGADDVPVKSLVVNITPKQASGTPSPTNVLPITGYAAANITRAGKNYLEHTLTSRTLRGLTYTVNADKSITVTGTATGASYLVIKSDLVLPAGTYTIAGAIENTSLYARDLTDNIELPLTFTIPDNHSLNVYLMTSSGAVVNGTVRPIIYLESSKEVYNISFGSAGAVYGAQLEAVSGMLTITKKHITIDGNTAISGAYSGGYYIDAHDCVKRASYTTDDIICNRLPTVLSQASVLQNALGITAYASVSSYPGQNWIFFGNGDSSIDTRPKMTEWLASNPLEVVYTLASPTSVQLSKTDVRSLLGNNNIWSDTGSVASCEYCADTKLYLEKLTNPDNDMTADANIASGQYFMSGNTLYLATANIANGASIIPGTNCTATNLAAALNAINS